MTSNPRTHDGDTFDYIIVGSGAGGGPVAARLARAGFRVLLIEAGTDPDALPGASLEVTQVPGFHGLATEDPALCWDFFVKHYERPPAGEDPKKNVPSPPDPLREGIYYPRAAALGGCTVHNAMITIAGPDQDWDDLADFVRDDSWNGRSMRQYFQRLELNEYRPLPTPPPAHWWGRAWDLLKWLVGFQPDHTSGRHGFEGWLHTSVADVSLGLSDKQLVKMLKAALWQARHAGLERAWTLVRRFLKGKIYKGLDPNDAHTQAESPEGLVLVPLAACGKRTPLQADDKTPGVARGRRSSPRELLLEVQAAHPDKLTIWTDTLVTKVLFDPGTPPRAVGVSFLRGRGLYRAHRRNPGSPPPVQGTPGTTFVKSGGEVILAGGAFNTPQLLMLSGIGDRAHLEEVARGARDAAACALTGRDGRPLTARDGSPQRVDLRGVGRNLQDRYEVTLISEMKHDFSVLDGATFKADGTAPPDRHLKEWRAEGTGLYTSNGAVMGIFKRSQPHLAQPDLFIFGIPLPFEGYKLNYSTVGDQHGFFTWAILKGHTRNSDGTVQLRSADPLDPPLINFHYFNEVSRPGESAKDPDVLALVEGVKFVRGITRRARTWAPREQHPGTAVPDDDAAINEWIRREAWGHHACGTCRMGPEHDDYAVLDSRFSVRDVDGLRVVDASVFPKIPGYFIVTNIYMASEKAADVIIEDAKYRRRDTHVYPRALRERELAAVTLRRTLTSVAPRDTETLPPPAQGDDWADDVAGLALSGGGIRSATTNLGILQAFAKHQWLRRIDFLSTVSGGGYIGSFLGRWYDRFRVDALWGGARKPAEPAPDRIESELPDPESPIVAWLRKHGNYIAPSGEGDGRVNAGTFVRNFLSVHFVIGLLLFAMFGLANGVRYGLLDPARAAFGLALMDKSELPLGVLLQAVLGPFFSVWFFFFELAVLFLVVPRIIGYWIVSQDAHERYQGPSLVGLFTITSVLLFLSVRDGFSLSLMLLAVAPLSALAHVEFAWWRGRLREEAIGSGGAETQRLRTRNLLTYDVGVALAVAGVAFGFAVIDTIAHALQQAAARNQVYTMAFASFGATLLALMPLARMAADLFREDRSPGPPSTLARLARQHVRAGTLAVVLLTVPLIFFSFVAHAAYQGGLDLWTGLGATGLALLVSLILTHPKALGFVNRSSLAQMYAARLARAYLGASNPLRHRPDGASVTEVMASDDVPAITSYQPYKAGGPLHLINVTVNQTIDFASLRGNRDRKGENVAVSPVAMSIGERYHAAWVHDDGGGAMPAKRRARFIPLGHVPGTQHPLVDETGRPAEHAELLSLRQWMSVSGAAITPGRGQATHLGTALLFGLANLRTGHWWDSGLTGFARDGFAQMPFFGRLAYVVQRIFLPHALLLAEWTARYPGPWQRFWYLSDGGFFENTAAYELIRRRVPRIILCDGSADPRSQFEDFAGLIRKVRIDFNATIEPFDAAAIAAANIPDAVKERLGTLDDLTPQMDEDGKIIGPSKKHAALFRVRYNGSPRGSVLLYLKSSLTGDESADVEHYHSVHREFPHEGTTDQFFDEAQWESYRQLGQHIAEPLVQDRWFWKLPLS